jgi:tetratricopeptide (TPR) repeat protein
VTERLQTRAAAAIVVMALVAVLGGQALADRAAPEAPNGALTGQALGRTGFAYLTGLRQFAAAFLWNRLEPQMHEYYGGVGLGRMTFMLPNVKAIVTLDPQFVEAYYVAPEILIESGNLQGGLDLAKEGVDNNPKSGLLLASYAQLIWTRGNDLQAALPYADRAMADDVVWRWDDEKWEGMAVVRAIFEKAGQPDKAAAAKAIQTAIESDPNATVRPTDED